MRYFLSCCLLLLCTSVRAQVVNPGEAELASTIDRVLVYLEGAQVQRKAETRVLGGRSALVFTGLTGSLDPGSVQLYVNNPEVVVLSVSHRLHFSEIGERSAAETAVYARIDALEDRRRELNTRVAIAQEEEELLRANRDLAGAASGVSADDLERGVRFHRERITAIKLSYLALSDSLRNNAHSRQQLQEELAALGQAQVQPATSQVVVEVESGSAQSVGMQLSYRVAAAGWTPEYDVRVDDISQPIDLRYRARVYQDSGEDWSQISLTLSTGDPSRSATAPDLRTWRVRPGLLPPVYQPSKPIVEAGTIRSVRGRVKDTEGGALIGATVLVEGTTVGTITDLDGRFELELPGEAEFLRVDYSGYNNKSVPITGVELEIVLEQKVDLLQEVVVTGYASNGVEDLLQGRTAGVNINRRDGRKAQDEAAPVPTRTDRQATSVTFAIELPYTIPSDGQPRSVEIKRYEVPATFHHLAVPKREPDVYLSAVVRDWEQYHLVSGDLQLFFEGTYLGTSRLEVERTADTLLLSLGRDPGVVVTREANKEFRVPGGFLSGKRVDSRGWTIAVRNTKQQPVELTILDQVPVSADGRVEVEVRLPEAALLDEDKGILKWKLTVPPSGERKLVFGYAVRYPAGQTVYIE